MRATFPDGVLTGRVCLPSENQQILDQQGIIITVTSGGTEHDLSTKVKEWQDHRDMS